MAITIAKDFTGEYSWAEAEAQREVEFFNEIVEEFNNTDADYVQDMFKYYLSRREHWLKVFENNMDDWKLFVETWNKNSSSFFQRYDL